jgi:putative heme-binding domain-containing protein
LQQLIAEIQGKSGNLLHWRVKGPMASTAIPSLLKGLAMVPALEPGQKQNLTDWQILFGSGSESGLTLNAKTSIANLEWLAFSDLFLNDLQEAEGLTSTDGKLRIWLDGKLVYQTKTPGTYKPDSDRFGVPLAKGWHRFLVAIAPSKNPARFHLQVRKKSSSAEQEKWMQLALNQKGNSAKGKEVFFNVNKSQCLKCHKLGNQGENIGPDLTNIGKRFSRTYLIESIVQPSRSIAPSYETLLIELKDGKVLNGTKIEETATVLVIGDKDGKKHTVPKNTIEVRAVVTQSVMPDNLVNQFTEQEFVDLIAFLEGQK